MWFCDMLSLTAFKTSWGSLVTALTLFSFYIEYLLRQRHVGWSGDSHTYHMNRTCGEVQNDPCCIARLVVWYWLGWLLCSYELLVLSQFCDPPQFWLQNDVWLCVNCAASALPSPSLFLRNLSQWGSFSNFELIDAKFGSLSRAVKLWIIPSELRGSPFSVSWTRICLQLYVLVWTGYSSSLEPSTPQSSSLLPFACCLI